MGLFTKKVVDADMCFIRDLMEVAAAIATVTSVAVGKEWLIQVVQKYSLVKRIMILRITIIKLLIVIHQIKMKNLFERKNCLRLQIPLS